MYPLSNLNFDRTNVYILEHLAQYNIDFLPVLHLIWINVLAFGRLDGNRILLGFGSLVYSYNKQKRDSHSYPKAPKRW
jgi:hypothetical protein